MSDPVPTPHCWSRRGPSAPWSESALTFGDASLLVRPIDGGDDVWVTYGEVTGVEEIGEPGPYGHVVEVVRAEGPLLQLALSDEVLDRFLAGLRRSVEREGAAAAAPTGSPSPEVPTDGSGVVERTKRTGSGPSRTRLIVLLAILVVLALVLVALVLIGSGDEEAASPDGGGGGAPSTTELDGAAPDTSPPPTTAEAADPDDPAAALAVEVASVRVGPPEGPATIYISTAVENLADTAIESYRVNFAVVAEVEAGRPVAAVYSLDCADAQLGPGATREGAYRVDDAEANATGLADCTVAGWPVDTDDTNEVAVHDALSEGVAADVGVEITRVALAGGTVLEERDDA